MVTIGSCVRRRQVVDQAFSMLGNLQAALLRPPTRAGHSPCRALEPDLEAIYTDVCNKECKILGCPGEQANSFADALLTYGAQAAWIEEFDGFPGLNAVSTMSEAHPAPGEDKFQAKTRQGQEHFWLPTHWLNCQVVALFSTKASHDEMRRVVGMSAKLAGVSSALEVTIGQVYQQDWEAKVRASYKLLQITDTLRIVPEWCQASLHASDFPGVDIRLKPGIAFGTGEHPTTRMCLQWIEQNLRPNSVVLDYGCGSGVLGIAACRLGASSMVRLPIARLCLRCGCGHVAWPCIAYQRRAGVFATRCRFYAYERGWGKAPEALARSVQWDTIQVAVDVDPVAVQVARSNAELNGCESCCTFLQCMPSSSDPDPIVLSECAGPSSFDICFANILKPALIDLEGRLASYLKPGGSLVLSGLLQDQVHILAGILNELAKAACSPTSYMASRLSSLMALQVAEVKDAYSADFNFHLEHFEGDWAILAAVKV